MFRVGVVHAIRREGGGSSRLSSWEATIKAAGLQPVPISVLAPGQRAPLGFDHVVSAASGRIAPETLAWSRRHLRRLVEEACVDAVVFLTLRAFDGWVPANRPVVIDLVDLLSESYRQRAHFDPSLVRRAGWRTLASAMRRAEVRTLRCWKGRLVAAGFEEATRAGAQWLPNVVDVPPLASRRTPADWDVLFSGTLDYGPNTAALRVLANEVWPQVRNQLPKARLCVAGRRPTPEVRSLVAATGGFLMESFSDFNQLAARCKLAVAPLPAAVGIQNKVLDAAAAGLPVIVTPAVARGVDPEFPLSVAASAGSFAAAIIELLTHAEAAAHQAAAGRAHVIDRYTARRWASTVARLVGGEP